MKYGAHLQTIPHQDQRYETAGDWGYGPTGILTVSVSDTGTEDYNFLLALHELVEAYLCKRANISVDAVEGFDIPFLMNPSTSHLEPGDSPESPYHRQHTQAEIVERVMCEILDRDWASYSESIEKLWFQSESTDN